MVTTLMLVFHLEDWWRVAIDMSLSSEQQQQHWGEQDDPDLLLHPENCQLTQQVTSLRSQAKSLEIPHS